LRDTIVINGNNDNISISNDPENENNHHHHGGFDGENLSLLKGNEINIDGSNNIVIADSKNEPHGNDVNVETGNIRRHKRGKKHGGKKDLLKDDGDTIIISGSAGNTVIVNSHNVDNGDGNGDGNNDGNGNGNGNGKFKKTLLEDTIVISDNNTNNNIFDNANNSDDNNSNQ